MSREIRTGASARRLLPHIGAIPGAFETTLVSVLECANRHSRPPVLRATHHSNGRRSCNLAQLATLSCSTDSLLSPSQELFLAAGAARIPRPPPLHPGPTRER